MLISQVVSVAAEVTLSCPWAESTQILLQRYNLGGCERIMAGMLVKVTPQNHFWLEHTQAVFHPWKCHSMLTYPPSLCTFQVSPLTYQLTQPLITPQSNFSVLASWCLSGCSSSLDLQHWLTNPPCSCTYHSSLPARSPNWSSSHKVIPKAGLTLYINQMSSCLPTRLILHYTACFFSLS